MGPAVVHCKAWASSLVDSFILLVLWFFFPRCRPTMDVALRSDHGANMSGILDDLHFSKLLTVCRHPTQQFMAIFTAILHPTTFLMIQVEPSNSVHHLERKRQGGHPCSEG